MGIFNDLFRHDEWNVGIVRAPISFFLDHRARPEIHWLPPPKRGRYLADPFAITRSQTVHIFCEEFDYSTFKGRIVCVELSGGFVSKPRVAIELPVHMSYPYLIEDKEGIYCIPETSEAGEVRLYKAESFPYVWKSVATILRDFPAVDSTVFRWDNRWWLTCSRRGSWTDLFVWFASDLIGPWKPHSNNPVKSDIASSRPAGTPFLHAGNLYRPSQDRSRTYGGRIIVNHVLRLSPTEFEEERVATIEPPANSSYPHGLHTISAAGNVTVLDAKRITFVKSAFKRSLMDNRRLLIDGLTHRVNQAGHGGK